MAELVNAVVDIIEQMVIFELRQNEETRIGYERIMHGNTLYESEILLKQLQ